MAFDTKPWRPFTHVGITYDLGHLDPRTVVYKIPPKGDKPELSYTVDVAFGTHCFTHGIPKHGIYDQALEYRDGREIRVFDFRRLELSRTLPDIVESMVGRKCKHGDRSNFFTIAATDENGEIVDYDVFFTVSKSSQKGRLNLFLQSAYVDATLPKPRPIRFEIILYNTLHGRPVR
jgi:hypothetical protein